MPWRQSTGTRLVRDAAFRRIYPLWAAAARLGFTRCGTLSTHPQVLAMVGEGLDVSGGTELEHLSGATCQLLPLFLLLSFFCDLFLPIDT